MQEVLNFNLLEEILKYSFDVNGLFMRSHNLTSK
jgi:hypothetical protein